MKRIVFFFALLPNLAFAAMTGEEFDAYVTGNTLTYADAGRVYGIEEYLSGRRVRWAFVGDQCIEGVWYDAGDQICFVYENNPQDRECWIFTLEGGRLQAQFAEDDGGRTLYETQKTNEPLTCLGPDVGV